MKQCLAELLLQIGGFDLQMGDQAMRTIAHASYVYKARVCNTEGLNSLYERIQARHNATEMLDCTEHFAYEFQSQQFRVRGCVAIVTFTHCILIPLSPHKDQAILYGYRNVFEALQGTTYEKRIHSRLIIWL